MQDIQKQWSSSLTYQLISHLQVQVINRNFGLFDKAL